MVRVRRCEMSDDLLELLQRDRDLANNEPCPWETHDTWGAYDGNTPVAVATGRAYRSEPTTYFLSTCFVAPEARGHGLQKRLIRARVRHAKRQGYLRAWTYTAVFSIASMRSLIACGFRPTRGTVVPGFVAWELPLCSTT